MTFQFVMKAKQPPRHGSFPARRNGWIEPSHPDRRLQRTIRNRGILRPWQLGIDRLRAPDEISAGFRSLTVSGLPVSKPGAPEERKAERVAEDVVMRRPEPREAATASIDTPVTERNGPAQIEGSAITPLPEMELRFFERHVGTGLAHVDVHGHPLEHEADRVADTIMGMANPAPRPPVHPTAGGAQAQPPRKCAACANKDSPIIQRKPSAHSSAVGVRAQQLELDYHPRALGWGGQPLPTAELNFFEPRFGYDFGALRVHTSSGAADAARVVNALAFTLGPNIVFAEGQYQPGTAQGRRLLAHELAHAVQAGAATPVRDRDAHAPQLLPSRASAGQVLRTPDPRLEAHLQQLTSLGRASQGSYATEYLVDRIFEELRTVDLSDPDNLIPVARVVSAAFSNPAVLTTFLQEGETRSPPRMVTSRPDVMHVLQVRGHPYLGQGGFGLFPYTGAAASAVVGSVRAVTASASAFLGGLVDGVREGLSSEDVRAFSERLAASSMLNIVFPIPFLAGTAVGIAREVYESIQAVIEIIGNFSKIVQQFAQLIGELLENPEAAHAMGHETGSHYAQRIAQLSRENLIMFAYHLGELVGPTIVYTVLSFLGLPEIAGAVLFNRLATVLRRFPRVARILDAIAARLHPRGVRPHLPDVPEGGVHPHARDLELPSGPEWRPLPPAPHAGALEQARWRIRHEMQRSVGPHERNINGIVQASYGGAGETTLGVVAPNVVKGVFENGLYVLELGAENNQNLKRICATVMDPLKFGVVSNAADSAYRKALHELGIITLDAGHVQGRALGGSSQLFNFFDELPEFNRILKNRTAEGPIREMLSDRPSPSVRLELETIFKDQPGNPEVYSFRARLIDVRTGDVLVESPRVVTPSGVRQR